MEVFLCPSSPDFWTASRKLKLLQKNILSAKNCNRNALSKVRLKYFMLNSNNKLEIELMMPQKHFAEKQIWVEVRIDVLLTKVGLSMMWWEKRPSSIKPATKLMPEYTRLIWAVSPVKPPFLAHKKLCFQPSKPISSDFCRVNTGGFPAGVETTHCVWRQIANLTLI